METDFQVTSGKRPIVISIPSRSEIERSGNELTPINKLATDRRGTGPRIKKNPSFRPRGSREPRGAPSQRSYHRELGSDWSSGIRCNLEELASR